MTEQPDRQPLDPDEPSSVEHAAAGLGDLALLRSDLADLEDAAREARVRLVRWSLVGAVALAAVLAYTVSRLGVYGLVMTLLFALMGVVPVLFSLLTEYDSAKARVLVQRARLALAAERSDPPTG